MTSYYIISKRENKGPFIETSHGSSDVFQAIAMLGNLCAEEVTRLQKQGKRATIDAVELTGTHAIYRVVNRDNIIVAYSIELKDR